ncbi:kinase-like protein [Rhizopus microsporus]|uniref:Kinase-like protein n=1 Tax=Rhizopus microsporus TaxID=58291 RepID=A0A1X0S470_RHIZD|nr:kinase-like protein [Rhizopus microsporus]
MGQGTFGQVVQCRELSTNNLVAVKVIKRHRAFTAQGEKEINTLKMLNDHSRYKDKYLQLRDHFVFRGHICLVFELLSVSLHKVLKQKPRLSILDIKLISVRILETLASLADLHIIHTDLKPDNILLKSPDDLHDVKLIDYGSACLETDRPTNYHIQTAFYRSPEVIIKAPYHCAVDMWSFGCFVAELYLEKPLFPSGNELILLHMMAKTLQSLPPDHMLHKGEKSQKFFHIKGTQSDVTKLREIGAHDISAASLDERITGHPRSDDDTEEDQKWLLDFLKKILVYDPDKRYTPRQALQHPFITSDPIIHSSSSISRTTEESNEIKTPSPPLHKPDAKPLKSILKKKSTLWL